MTTQLMPFEYNSQTLRTMVIDGEPWFVLADLCAAVGLTSTTRVAERIDPDALSQTQVIDSMGRAQSATIVSEAGMYEVVIRSDKPEAVAYRRWVTGTVLPTIRKTGSYGRPALPDITTPAGVLAMAEQFASTARALVASEAKVSELAPRAEVADRLLDADGDMSVADTAKALTRAGVKVGEGRLFTALATKGWIFRSPGDGRWRVYQKAIESGHMSVIPMSHYHPKTGVLVLDPPQPRVTPKGLQRLLLDHGAVVPA